MKRPSLFTISQEVNESQDAAKNELISQAYALISMIVARGPVSEDIIDTSNPAFVYLTENKLIMLTALSGVIGYIVTEEGIKFFRQTDSKESEKTISQEGFIDSVKDWVSLKLLSKKDLDADIWSGKESQKIQSFLIKTFSNPNWLKSKEINTNVSVSEKARPYFFIAGKQVSPSVALSSVLEQYKKLVQSNASQIKKYDQTLQEAYRQIVDCAKKEGQDKALVLAKSLVKKLPAAPSIKGVETIDSKTNKEVIFELTTEKAKELSDQILTALKTMNHTPFNDTLSVGTGYFNEDIDNANEDDWESIEKHFVHHRISDKVLKPIHNAYEDYVIVFNECLKLLSKVYDK